jgi:glycosyltransferase involved in cell wall biosynthesis
VNDHSKASDVSARLRVAHFQRRPLPSVNFSAEGIFETVRLHLPADIETDLCVVPHPSRGVTPRLRNTAWVARHQHQVNHITGDIHYVALGLPGPRTILTVLDCVFLTNPSALRRTLIKWFWYRLPIHRVAAVTVISEFTRTQLVAAVPASENKVRVIPACVPMVFVPTERASVPPRPIVLQVGTPPNKNIERLAQALAGLNCALHVVGSLNATQSDALKRNRIEYRNSIGLTPRELVRAYADCDVVSFCSTHEGFGMPIIEAQLVGRPIVTSNVTAMPEIAGEGACLVDPLDERSIRGGIERVLLDGEYRAALVARGRVNAERFKPARVADAYAEVYRQVAASAK